MIQSETKVQNNILNYLSLMPNIFAWRNNSVGVYDPRKKIFRKPTSKYNINGVSDILGVINTPIGGVFLAIEVKKDSKGKASKYQEYFINEINAKGGIAFVAYSIDCVEYNFKNAEIERSIKIY